MSSSLLLLLLLLLLLPMLLLLLPLLLLPNKALTHTQAKRPHLSPTLGPVADRLGLKACCNTPTPSGAVSSAAYVLRRSLARRATVRDTRSGVKMIDRQTATPNGRHSLLDASRDVGVAQSDGAGVGVTVRRAGREAAAGTGANGGGRERAPRPANGPSAADVMRTRRTRRRRKDQ